MHMHKQESLVEETLDYLGFCDKTISLSYPEDQT